MNDEYDTNNIYHRIRQTVMHGSLYEAFYNKFVNIFDVLEYLLKYEPENEIQREKMCIAYRIVCIFTKEQPINGTHFICLTKNEDYICIYALSFNSHFKNNTISDFDENIEISKKIQKILPKLIKETTAAMPIKIPSIVSQLLKRLFFKLLKTIFR